MDAQTAAEAMRADVQETYDFLRAEAGKALNLGGSFAPFGAGVRADGERTLAQADLAVESSTPEDHIALLIAGFAKEAAAGELRLAALAFDSAFRPEGGEETPALVIHIEHVGGEGVQIFIPYRRGEEVAFGEPVIQPVEPEVFKDAPPASA